jgi:hypothetical protein
VEAHRVVRLRLPHYLDKRPIDGGKVVSPTITLQKLDRKLYKNNKNMVLLCGLFYDAGSNGVRCGKGRRRCAVDVHRQCYCRDV